MTDDELRKALTDAVTGILRPLKGAQRQEGVEFLLALGYELARGTYGNEWARGWVRAALDDLKTDPPRVVMNELH